MLAEANVLTYMMIYLAAMVAVVPLAKRLGLGVVLGYLLAGVALGPYGFSIAGETKSIEVLAELGIVLMLFTIGLEIDLMKLWGMRRYVFGYGLLQMAICGIALAIAAHFFGFGLAPSLILGFTLAMSSSAIAVQLMNDRQMMGTTAGRATLGILLLQDMVAIPLLIYTSVMFPASGATAFKPLFALGAVLLVAIAGRFLVSHLLRWIVHHGSRELFVGVALLLVIAVMELMTAAGVSAGLGAFIAGVLLASTEFKHELEADLDPFKGLFLGLFFITIGSGINLNLLLANWPGILGLLLGLITLKFFLIYGQGWLLRMGRADRLGMATLLQQGNELGFVIAGAAVAGHMLTNAQGEWINLVIALSMATSSVLMRVQDWYVGRFISPKGKRKEMDKDMEQNAVIIAGFGRFGQIVGRLLMTNGVRSTVLDLDMDLIELMRRVGYQPYYGDATRVDLMEVAGAHHAKLLVVAVDNKDTALQIVEMAKQHFPNLHIFARAYDVRDMEILLKAGAHSVHRELFEGSLALGRDVLEKLGYGRYEARELADGFRAGNIKLAKKLGKLRTELDEKEFIKIVRSSVELLGRQLTEESRRTEELHNIGQWIAARNAARDAKKS